MNIGAEVEWRKDSYGHEAHALYLGELYVGHIMRVVPGQWRNWGHLNETDPDPEVEKRHQERREYYESRDLTPWRGWFMKDDDGDEIGFFATAEEARGSVEKHLFSAIKFAAAG